MKNRRLWVGALLAFSGLVGYLTVADDFRHVGELVGVSAVFMSGLALMAFSIRSKKIIRDSSILL